MLNKIVLIGRLTKDPDIRHTQSGVATTRFTLAVDRGFKGQDGEKQTDFIPVVTWRGLADNVGKYGYKGQMVAVAGRIQTGSYEKDGRRVYTTDVNADEVRFLEWGEKVQDEPGFTPMEDDEPLPF